MVASEFGFLVLGLILGVPTGAALLVVIRARPPSPREVRLTVTPGSVPVKRSATLAGDPFAPDGPSSAHAGPADIEWHGGPPERPRPEPVGSVRDGQLVVAGAPEPAASPWPVDSAGPPRNGTPVRQPVGLAVGAGIDPVLSAMRRDRPRDPRPGPGFDQRSRATVASGIGLLEAAVRERVAARSATAVAERAEGPIRGRRDGGTESAREQTTGPATPPPVAHEPTSVSRCADERRAVDERCSLAGRLAESAETAAAALRTAQREYDEHAARADAAAAASDVRAQRAAKDAAQRAFRAARSEATSRESIEAAARTWLHEINRINTTAREATAELARERAAAVALITPIERLSLEADAARVQSESAAEACREARSALAACEEAAVAAARSSLEGRTPPPAAAEVRAPTTPTPGGSTGSEDVAIRPAAIADSAISRLLDGDAAVLEHLVAELTTSDDDTAMWSRLLTGLVDAIVGRALEACAFDFPETHPFWSLFSQSQARDVALALSSLGFRADGLGHFADDRIPSQRELSLALGYAGLDPMRIRRWPNEAEMADLYGDVRIAANEYLVGTAPGLTLGELVTLLGHRADGLTELWNRWGRVRPALLERI